MADKIEEPLLKKCLKETYDRLVFKAVNVVKVFQAQFTEELVDSSLCSFQQFYDCLAETELETLGENVINSVKNMAYMKQITLPSALNSCKFLEAVRLIGVPKEGSFWDFYFEYFIKKMSQVSTLEPEENHIDGDFCITVRFPSVIISNEYDRRRELKELYARVELGLNGHIVHNGLKMVRTELTSEEFTSDYSHSHLPGVYYYFVNPCLGKGPICRTMATLETKYDLDFWGLFTFELSKYVEVESLEGVPYRRMDSIGTYDLVNTGTVQLVNSGFLKSNIYIKDFINYFLSLKQMKFSYSNGTFRLGEPYELFWIKVSNAFITWWNSMPRKNSFYTLKRTNIIKEYLVAEGLVYNIKRNQHRDLRNSDTITLVFKGEPKYFVVDRSENSQVVPTVLVSPNICSSVIAKALLIVNFNYGRDKDRKTCSEEAVQGERRCLYI